MDKFLSISNFVRSWLTTIDDGLVNDELTVALVTRDTWIIARFFKRQCISF